jgi:hypothetical protein
MLWQKSLEIWVFPPKQFHADHRPIAFPYDGLKDQVMLTPDSSWYINIDHIDQNEIMQSNIIIGSAPNTDLAKGVKFVLHLSRKLIIEYLKKAYIAQPMLKKLRHEGNLSKGLVGVVWNGLLVRDFQHTVMLLLASINVSSPLCFPVSQIRYHYFGREATGDGFHARSLGRDELRLPMKCNDVSTIDFFKFIQSIRDELLQEPTSQFGKSFSFLTYSLSNRAVSPLSAMIWAVAAIEALVGEKDRSSRKLVETRLMALLPDLHGSNTIRRFRKLYELRSEVIHGAASVPVVFSERSVASAAYAFDDAAFSQFLAVKMLHKYFELGKKDVEFHMVVKQ